MNELLIRCHSERSEESECINVNVFRFFAFAQNDTIYFLESRKNYTFVPY